MPASTYVSKPRHDEPESDNESEPDPDPAEVHIPDSPDPIDVIDQEADSAVELDDDGHEDMNESALQAALEDGLSYMESDECEMTFIEAMDFVLTEMALKADTDSTTDPRTLKEALRRPDADKWYQAALEEVESLVENGTFRVRERRPGDKPIGARWVLRVKRKADGSIERYKGRVVAKGYSQRPGFDYTARTYTTIFCEFVQGVLTTGKIPVRTHANHRLLTHSENTVLKQVYCACTWARPV